jgi:sporulation protein YlmC with PRC-barrel domain
MSRDDGSAPGRSKSMSETRLLTGTGVRCTDGICGHLQRIIVDSGGAVVTVTHLAVEPDGLREGRLVPAELVASVGADILLRCSRAEFEQLESTTRTSPEYTASWPYPDEGPGGRYPSGWEGVERDTGYGNRTPTRDRIPAGGVEVRSGEPVYAVDGEAGRVRALIVDLRDRRVTGLELDRGHLGDRLRGRHHRERVAVPIGSVRTFGDGVQLELSREAVDHLAHEEVT